MGGFTMKGIMSAVSKKYMRDDVEKILYRNYCSARRGHRLFNVRLKEFRLCRSYVMRLSGAPIKSISIRGDFFTTE